MQASVFGIDERDPKTLPENIVRTFLSQKDPDTNTSRLLDLPSSVLVNILSQVANSKDDYAKTPAGQRTPDPRIVSVKDLMQTCRRALWLIGGANGKDILDFCYKTFWEFTPKYFCLDTF